MMNSAPGRPPRAGAVGAPLGARRFHGDVLKEKEIHNESEGSTTVPGRLSLGTVLSLSRGIKYLMLPEL